MIILASALALIPRDVPMRLDRGMDVIAGSLITIFDYVWARLTGRLSGLTDDEYFWEPVAGCWSLRQGDDEHYQTWRAGLTRLTPSEWSAPLGPSWGPYSDTSTVDLALHVLDEVVHHGAEVGLLRDLYSHRSSLHG